MSSHLRESGSDDEAAEAEEERGEALALQTLHQHAHLRRHRYGKKEVPLVFNVLARSTFHVIKSSYVFLFQRRSSS